jgi:hypothetical protein
MGFGCKWMQLQDIMLSEVSQDQEDKGCMFSLICGRQIQKINIYTKPSMIIYEIEQERLCSCFKCGIVGVEEKKDEVI